MKASVVVVLLFATPAFGQQSQAVPRNIPMQIAQSNACQQMTENARTCYDRWQNIGGGRGGQAGTFYDCMVVYCNGAIAVCGRAPSFCPR